MLPKFQTDNKDVSLLQARWASEIDPFLVNPSLKTLIIKDVKLISGTNVVNHLLGRKIQGWRIVRRRQFIVVGVPTAYDIYDVQDNNQHQGLTLLLTCDQGTTSNPVLVNIEVF